VPFVEQIRYSAELEANSSYTVRTIRVVLDGETATANFALTGGYPISILSVTGVLPASQGLILSIGGAELFAIPTSIAAVSSINLERRVNVLAGVLTNNAGNLTIVSGVGSPTGTFYITIAQKGRLA